MSAPNWWGDWRPILTPHTGNLQPTDLLECTSIVGGLPVNTAITGAQIIAAASGGATWGSITGTLSSQTDLQTALNGKQDTLISGTNIKTINGSSILGSGNLTVSGSNIYNADGTLTAARTLTQGGFDLTIAGTTSSRFFSNGNVGIGTTTNAGFKLDVNGTARVSGQITGQAQFTNSTPTSTNSILLNGISTTDTGTRTLISIGTLSSTGILYGAIGIQGSLQNNSVGTLITTTTAEAIGHMANATSGTNTVNGFTARTNGQGTGGSIGFTWRVSNSTFFWHSIYNDGTYYNLRLFNGVGAIYYVRDRTTTNITFGANTYYASAQLAIDSTTKGFLPPRMTNAQMLAIAAPAAGLVVYDTTNNKHCGYNGTAWQNFY
jgi:hypothetical protein